MSRLHVWLLASRPATLTAVVSPLVVGGALAVYLGQADVLAWLAALLGALFIQLGTNYANDVFDYEKGADTSERVGPMRAVQAGLVTPGQMRTAMILAFALATLCGTYLVWLRGWPLVWIGLASIASGIAYTGGPFPLGYNGLGDVFVMLFFGFVATIGTYFVQAGTMSQDAWLLTGFYGLPIGATCTAILVVNNLRDMDTDVKVGKRTLAVRFGASFVRAEYAVMLFGALAASVLATTGQLLAENGGCVRPGYPRGAFLLLPLVLTPWAVRLNRTLRSTRDPAVLNPLLGATARFHLFYGLLTALGLLLVKLT